MAVRAKLCDVPEAMYKNGVYGGGFGLESYTPSSVEDL